LLTAIREPDRSSTEARPKLDWSYIGSSFTFFTSKEGWLMIKMLTQEEEE
jgi:hypothetical protein